MNLETDRLFIRPHIADDFEDYFGYIMEPELQYMLGLNDVHDRASAQETFQWLMENSIFLALVYKETGKTIGHISLQPPVAQLLEDPNFKGKTGYSLSFAIAKPMRRKGLMQEALRSVIDELFMSQKASFIDCEYTTFNAASHALQEKIGFSYWGKEQFGGVELIINTLKREDWHSRLNPDR